jgi:hypothetical protein
MKRPAPDTKPTTDPKERPDAGHDGRLAPGSSLDQKQHDNAKQTGDAKAQPGSARPK